MKQNKHNLEEYFAEARRRPDLISRDEARSLVEHGPAGGSLLSHFINNFKGAGLMNMITLSVAAAAAALMIGINAAGTDDHSNLRQARKQSANTKIAAKHSQPVIKKEAEPTPQQIAETPIKKESPAANEGSKIEKTLEKIARNNIESPRHEIRGVSMLKLNPSELERLGLVPAKGGFRFVIYKQTDNPVLISLFKDSINTRFNEDVAQMADVPVRFITDADGNRRLGALSKKNSSILAKYDTGNKVVHLQASILDDKELFKKLGNKNKKMSVRKTITLMSKDSISGDSLEYTDKILDEEAMVMVDSVMRNAAYQMDSVVSEALKDVLKKVKNDKDNSAAIAEEASIKVDSVVRSADLQMDSVVSEAVMDALNKRKNDKDDSVVIAPGKLRRILLHSVNARDNKDIKISEVLDNVLDDIQHIEIDLNEFEKINKMLPVAVDLDGGGTDYILWLEPTSEVIANLPDDIRANLGPEFKALADADNFCEVFPKTGGEPFLDIWRGCSGDVKHMKVYPNPASANINVEYELGGERDVTISLHDMYGRRIRQLGSYPSHPAGSHTEAFALGRLEAGMYLISIQANSGEHAVQRVIIK
jgi:hypothetical protein